MKTRTMICEQDRFEYPPGVYHAAGDEFEVEENDVVVLTVTGKAKRKHRVKEQSKPKDLEPRKTYATRDIIHAPNRKALAN